MKRRLTNKYKRTMLYLDSHGRCNYCGCKVEKGWHSDHYIPWCLGGSTNIENMKVSCPQCNLKKGKKMDQELTPYNYESMRFFNEDFSNAKNVRICQIGTYNAAIHHLVAQNKKSFSAFIPTGCGKSDIVKAISHGLVRIHKKFAGAWVFSPSGSLKDQMAEHDETFNCYERLGEKYKVFPILTCDDLEADRFRNNAIIESFTIQYLTTGLNVNAFIKAARNVFFTTGKMPVAIFDESHMFGCDSSWGIKAKQLQDADIPIVLVTGTPYRSDNQEIPGFKMQFLEDCEKKYIKTQRTEDPLLLQVTQGVAKIRKYKLIADYEYTYARAYDDNVILQPTPIFVDATETTYNNLLSDMPKGVDRLLRDFLLHDRTISECVKACVSSIRQRKYSDPSCAALVATLSDEDALNDEYADLHAKKIKNEFNRQAPDLKVLVVTSKTNSVDGIKRFKQQEEYKNGTQYDVLVVKTMGTTGLNAPRIKTVLNLSNIRTLPSTVQLINRGCRKMGNFVNFDYIMPKDRSGIEMWMHFQDETGLEIEKKESISEDTRLQEISNSEKSEKNSYDFADYQISINPNFQRTIAEERVEMVNKKFPVIANRMDNQEKLNFYNEMASGLGDNWLEKFEDRISEGFVNQDAILYPQQEEKILREDVNLNVRQIVMQIFTIMDRKYDSTLYGKINSRLWTVLKRRCGFEPAKKLNNLQGIENFKKILVSAEWIKNNLIRLPTDRNFDFEKYLSEI